MLGVSRMMRWAEQRFSVAKRLGQKLRLTRYNFTEFYYAYSPLVQNKTCITPLGFSLTGGNSVHHKGMQDGTFESTEADLFAKYLERVDVFVDVGANIGYFVCLARKAGKKTIAIEPQPRNLQYLYKNIIANSWNDVEVYPVGLSHSPGVAVLYGASSTGASLIPGWAGATKTIKRLIPLSTLDILVGSRFANAKLLIKIDVEGAEHDVLRGAINTLKMNPRPIWMVEITADQFYPGGMNPKFFESFRLFFQSGYEARSVARDCSLVTEADLTESASKGDLAAIGYNFIFSSRKSPDSATGT
jgi:FkbM family methyltransferase